MISKIKYEDMHSLSNYQKELMKKPQLTFLFLELTDSCNLKCQHCGSNCTSRNRTYLSLTVIEKLLTDVAKIYNPSEIMICITGGEPMLHPDIYEIIKKAKSNGFLVGMTTNGTLITNLVASRLFDSGLDTVAISIDGLERAHDDFRNVKGAFKKALEGIHNLRKVGINPQVVTVVHKNNINELDRLYNLLCKERFDSWRITTIEPIGRAKEDKSLLLGKEELRVVFDFIRAKRVDINCKMEVTYGCAHFVNMDYEREIRDFYFQCGAGTKVASIRANGDIVACLDIEDCHESIQGNIYKDDFIEAWETKYLSFREDRSEKCKMCRDCQNKEYCMGDAAHTWDFKNNKPFYCVSKLMEV